MKLAGCFEIGWDDINDWFWNQGGQDIKRNILPADILKSLMTRDLTILINKIFTIIYKQSDLGVREFAWRSWSVNLRLTVSGPVRRWDEHPFGGVAWSRWRNEAGVLIVRLPTMNLDVLQSNNSYLPFYFYFALVTRCLPEKQ